MDANHPDLVAYWNFDEGAGFTVGDATRHGHDLLMTEKPDWVVSYRPTASLYWQWVYSHTASVVTSFLFKVLCSFVCLEQNTCQWLSAGFISATDCKRVLSPDTLSYSNNGTVESAFNVNCKCVHASCKPNIGGL